MGSGTVQSVEMDILGSGYLSRTLDLGSDYEGPVVATLISRPPTRPTGRAVLYLHGYVDYFFHTHIAEFYLEQGFHFYALDLRKHGRSLRPHQTPNFMRDIREYFPEIDEAVRVIREEDGHERLLINAHSTGGLVAALWAHQNRATGQVDAMFLNSPFFEFNEPRWIRQTVGPMSAVVSRFRPYAIMPRGLHPVYGHSIHADHYGEWQFDVAWKPIGGFPVRVAWLAAVRAAQAELHAGLDIPVPILVACSAASYRKATWSEAAMTADAVLDVEHIAQYASRLGRHVTIVRIEGGMHDLTLSSAPVRARVFDELERWMRAYLPESPKG
jgi:alpha-beta hydrolase superfamily lysophospholipase